MSAPAGGLSQVVIRPAEPEDLPVLGRLGALLVRLHHEFDPARFVAAPPRTEHLYAAFLADQLRKPNGVVLVAEMGGEVLGYTYASVEDSDYMALRGPADYSTTSLLIRRIEGTVSDGGCSTPRWRRSKLAVRHASCFRRRSGTPAHSASSHARDSGVR